MAPIAGIVGHDPDGSQASANVLYVMPDLFRHPSFPRRTSRCFCDTMDPGLRRGDGRKRPEIRL